MKKTFASFAFGCRVNEAEKMVLDKKLIELGFVFTEENPDIYIINSCAVTGKAEHEVKQFINQIRKKFPQTKLIVTGCAATNWINHKTKVNNVDVLICNNDKNNLIKVVEEMYYTTENKKIKDPQNDNNFTMDKFLNSGRRMVKIQDGCERFCSYCIVPYLRGKPTSKTISEILEEIHEHKSNIQEVILTAINTQYFGLNNHESLPQLLDAILEHTDIPRISFGSIHPWSITLEFLDWYKKNATNPRFVHFFHIPIQSGSNTILRLMNRIYTHEEMFNRLQQLAKINPQALIGTDIIVGFPGETDTEFDQTYNFLQQSPINKFHVFRYSPRTGTHAIDLENKYPQISLEVKQKRSQKLINLGKSKYEHFLYSLINKSFSALTLQTYKDGYQEVLLKNQIPALIKTKLLKPGTFVNIKIIQIKNNLSYGEIID